jgi:hypothetical protein
LALIYHFILLAWQGIFYDEQLLTSNRCDNGMKFNQEVITCEI